MAEDPREALARERALRREREIEIAEQRRRAEVAEAQAAALRETLSFGLGKAILDARTPQGLVRLPSRVLALRREQQAKRDAASSTSPAAAPPSPATLVAEARERAQREGLASSRRRLIAAAGRRIERARALAELALDQVVGDPDEAVETGLAAASLVPGEARLWVVVAALWDVGAVRAPRRLLQALRDPPSAAFRRVADQVEDAALRLDGARERPSQAAAASGSVHVVVTPSARPFGDDALAWQAEAAVAASLAAGRSTAFLTPPGYPDPAAEAVSFERQDGVWVLRQPLVPADSSLVAQVRDLLVGAGAGSVTLIASGAASDIAVGEAAMAAGCRLELDVGAFDRWLVSAPDSERGRAAGAILRTLASWSDAVTTRNAAAAERLDALGVATTITPLALPEVGQPDAELVAALHIEFGVPEDARLYACPVPLEQDYGLLDLLPALAAGLSDAVILFTGAGPFRRALSRRAAELGLFDRVRFVGPLTPAEQPAAIAICDALLMPRHSEAAIAADWSSAAAIAAALHVPVYASAAEARWLAGTTVPFKMLDAARLFGTGEGHD